MGCAKPMLTRVDGANMPVVLGGGRKRLMNTSDVLVWVNSDGMGQSWDEYAAHPPPTTCKQRLSLFHYVTQCSIMFYCCLIITSRNANDPTFVFSNARTTKGTLSRSGTTNSRSHR
jgi:hypothetical protein